MIAEYNNYDLEGMPRGFYTNERSAADDSEGAVEPGVRIDDILVRWAIPPKEESQK